MTQPATPPTAGATCDLGGASPACSAAEQLGAGAQEFLKALASPQRQQMLALFAGGIELTVGTVAERLGLAQPTASQHLALLRRGGLLTSRKDGKQVYYRFDTPAVEQSLTELQSYLRVCCPPEGAA